MKKKHRYTMQMAYEDAAMFFEHKGDLTPSHCEVRCIINDQLDSLEKDGFLVNHGYNQDKAHREVLKLLKK